MGNAYVMVVLGIILAKGVGFFREIFFSGTFGTGIEAGIYLQVFNLVNLIFAGIGVALSTLVIKNMNKAENAGNEKAYVASFLRKSFIALTAAALAVVVFAKPIVTKILLPGISDEHIFLAVKLMYIMAPSLVFVVIAYIISGVLQNEKVFFITAIMSLPFNAVIIASLAIPNVSITTVSLITTIGWFLHVVILLPSFFKKGYSLISKSKKTSTVKDKNPEIIWIFISNMMFQLLFYSDRAFISSHEDMISTLGYASNLFVIIASVFVVAMSTVFFPAISKNYEEGQIEYVNGLVKYIITVMAAIFLPYLLVVGLFGKNIICLLYERDAFTPEATAAVSSVLFLYSLGVLGYIAQELFNKILYLAGKYKYCVFGTIGFVLLNLLTNSVICTYASDMAFLDTGISVKTMLIAASSSFFLLCYAIMISFAIKTVVGKYWRRDLLSDISKIFICAVLAFAVYFIFKTFAPTFTHGKFTFIIPLAVCGVVYIASLALSGVLMRLIKKER